MCAPVLRLWLPKELRRKTATILDHIRWRAATSHFDQACRNIHIANQAVILRPRLNALGPRHHHGHFCTALKDTVLTTAAVIARENNHGIFTQAKRIELIQHRAHIIIHPRRHCILFRDTCGLGPAQHILRRWQHYNRFFNNTCRSHTLIVGRHIIITEVILTMWNRQRAIEKEGLFLTLFDKFQCTCTLPIEIYDRVSPLHAINDIPTIAIAQIVDPSFIIFPNGFFKFLGHLISRIGLMRLFVALRQHLIRHVMPLPDDPRAIAQLL